MATAHLTRPDHTTVGPKVHPAPKTASTRAWWNEARKVIRELDYFEDRHVQYVGEDIIQYVGDFGTLWIHRKKGHLGT